LFDILRFYLLVLDFVLNINFSFSKVKFSIACGNGDLLFT